MQRVDSEVRLFGIGRNVYLFPQAADQDDLTVVAAATDAVPVVPRVHAAGFFAVQAFLGDTEVNQKPREMPPHGSPPSIR
jgi:hypothetical protein